MRHALEVTQSVHGVVRASWHADPEVGVVLGEGGHLAPDDEVAVVHRLAEHDGSGWRVRAWPHWVGRMGAATEPLELDLPDEGAAVEVVLGIGKWTESARAGAGSGRTGGRRRSRTAPRPVVEPNGPVSRGSRGTA